MQIPQDILARIPHRPPFLWIDSIEEQNEQSIITKKYIPEDLDVFQGHYPDHPIMPGVLLCEAIFQSGALLMSYLLESSDDDFTGKVPVLTRISNAKFKRTVHPGDTVVMHVQLKETLASVSFLKGTMKVDGKVAVQVEFSCALASPK